MYLMCEYTAGCSLVTDPLAKALSENPRESDAICLVLCPRRHCLLAAAYDIPGRGGDVICVPHMKALARSWLKPEAVEDHDAELHWHPQIEALANFEQGETWFARCTCGTWNYRPASVAEMIAASREGRLLPPGELVKVRHASDQVTKLGRAWAESNGMQIVGRVERSPRLLGPYVLASYVGMADQDTPERDGIDRKPDRLD